MSLLHGGGVPSSHIKQVYHQKGRGVESSARGRTSTTLNTNTISDEDFILRAIESH